MKSVIAMLAMIGVVLVAHADEGGNRTFEITVREMRSDGKIVSLGAPEIIVAQCGRPAQVRLVRETAYLANPDADKGSAAIATLRQVALIGYVAATGCEP